MSLRDLKIAIDYTGRGEEILRRFVLPVIAEAVEYDRVTSFFTTESLVALAAGLEGMWHRKGRMRLVIGLHDVPADLAEAAKVAEDPTEEVISGVRERIISGIATLSDEISIDRLSTIAWMIQAGLLTVKVAAPERLAFGRPGLFHNKVFIFRDEQRNVVAAVGSPNETGAGLGNNFEHLTAFTSWEQPPYTDAQCEFFERLWDNQQESLQVRTLDARFAEEILAAIAKISSRINRPQADSVKRLLAAAARMPALAMVAGSHTALYPHQELAFLESLSRWPVRAMLSDEVGLGKTFEAGAVLRYMVEHGGVSRILILAPKAVIYQWQAELSEHFGIEAWVYESGRRAYVSPTEKIAFLHESDAILCDRTPKVAIVSAQLARGTRGEGHIFSHATTLPEMLVVDEAHAARVKPDISGGERPTLMWRMLNDVKLAIPHVVFATATPLQVHWREYHALLELLGLPEEWEEPDNYRQSLELATRAEGVDLPDASLVARLIRASLTGYRPSELDLTNEEREIAAALRGCTKVSVTEAMLVKLQWPAARSLLNKVHPARFLTIRNTRTSLEAIGYSFPKRNLPPYALEVPDKVKLFYQQVDTYLSESYFEVEKALYPDRKFSVGFVKCAYQQRLASSLHACKKSLVGRRSRIDEASESFGRRNVDRELDELTESDVFEQDPPIGGGAEAATEDAVARAIQAARIERVFIDDLVKSLDSILLDVGDPKMSGTVSLLEEHLSKSDKILVFSRYTDTLDAVVDAFTSTFGTECPPFAVYTGEKAELHVGNGAVRASRSGIREALEKGKVRVVFCSDAASEGLNLQAARVLINVDVPWNPARLEQRIGRIARLGQRSASVDVYNLWYPESVESRMYTRLLQRTDLYELAVGEFPDVVGSAIRDQLAGKFGSDSGSRDIVSELNSMKNNTQIRALRTLWSRDVASTTLTGRFRSELASIAMAAAAEDGAEVSGDKHGYTVRQGGASFEFSVEPGRDDVISLTHPVLRWLAQKPIRLPGFTSILLGAHGPEFFKTRDGPVDPMTVTGLLRHVAALSTPDEISSVRSIFATADGILRSRWLPDSGRLTIPINLECQLPPSPKADLSALSIKAEE